MSEQMDRAVLTMPYELAMGDELSRMQFWSRVQLFYKEQAARIEADEALMREIIKARDTYGWSVECDEKLNALRSRLETK